MTKNTSPTAKPTQVATYHRILIDGKILSSRGNPIHFTDTESAITVAAYLLLMLSPLSIKVEYSYEDPLTSESINWHPSTMFEQYISEHNNQNLLPTDTMFNALDECQIDYLAYPLCIGVQRAENIHCRRR